MAENGYGSSYGKKSMTQWIVIYLVIGAIVYGLVYYFIFAKKGGYTYPGSTSGTTQQAPSNEATAAQNTVEISNFKFAPATLTIKAGDTVTWMNKDSMDHSATADDKSFDTGLFEQGKTGTHMFSKAGTYKYHCSAHPNMLGTIIVQ